VLRSIAAGLLRRIADNAKRSNGRDGQFVRPVLTKRERQAAELIKRGLSDKEIARCPEYQRRDNKAPCSQSTLQAEPAAPEPSRGAPAGRSVVAAYCARFIADPRDSSHPN
jgi:hypothetical protein